MKIYKFKQDLIAIEIKLDSQWITHHYNNYHQLTAVKISKV